MALDTSTFDLKVTTGETTTVGLVTNKFPLPYTHNPTSLTDGTGAAQAQKVVTVSATVDGTGTTYDLTAIAGGPGNATVNFTAVKWLIIENTHASDTLVIGNAAANHWTGFISGTNTLTLRPGGILVATGPDATGMVTSGTSKNVLIKAGSSSTTFKMIVVGEGS